MEEEELIKKLDNIKIPNVELNSHRSDLREILIKTGYPPERRGIGLRLEKICYITIRGLISQQPVWKPLALGALVVALAIGLTYGLLKSDEQSSRVLAAEIIKMVRPEAVTDNDVRVVTEDGIEIIRAEDVINIACKIRVKRLYVEDLPPILLQDNGITVAFEAPAGDTDIVFPYPYAWPFSVLPDKSKLSGADREKAMDILRDDPEVQALLGQDATIYSVIRGVMIYGVWESGDSNLISMKMVTGEKYILQIEISIIAVQKAVPNEATAVLERGHSYWVVHIDLAAEEVKSIKLRRE